MSQDTPQTIPQADLIAIDALFKRIAERGRRIRTKTQNTTHPKTQDQEPQEVKNEEQTK